MNREGKGGDVLTILTFVTLVIFVTFWLMIVLLNCLTYVLDSLDL